MIVFNMRKQMIVYQFQILLSLYSPFLLKAKKEISLKWIWSTGFTFIFWFIKICCGQITCQCTAIELSQAACSGVWFVAQLQGRGGAVSSGCGVKGWLTHS